tara:strand:- start:162 stop:2663 length:2502 start_codon:yes stop_codon:yes gene_type:complete
MAIDREDARTTVTIPGPKDLQKDMAMQENYKQPIEIIEDSDGGATIDFDPQAMAAEGGEQHEANLADFLDEDALNLIGIEMRDLYDEYKASRSEWEDTYTKGLELLGFKYESRVEPFQGASGATHPVLAEAVTQFQALAYKELLPAGGPVRTQIVGKQTPQREDQATRVKEFMNYQIMVNMKEYEPEFDQMLFNLPLAGSTFKKVYYDSILQRCVSKFVPAEDLFVPYSATSLEDADCIIHQIKMTGNDLVKLQLSGFYSDVELEESSYDPSDVKKEKDELQGVSSNADEVYTLLECHADLEIPGFEDINPETQEATGLKVPYIITVDEGSGKVLSVRRNYSAQDPNRKRKDYFVHFKFLPGLGFYGFGLIHMIGGLSRTATAALRQLLDAGTLSNLPSGFKQRGIRVRDEAQPLQPGEFRDVDAPGGNLRDAFMPLPFKEPSQTLLSLMGVVVQGAQRFASIADMQVGDGNQSAAVGTTVALLERGSRVMSAIHKRLYQAMKCEFMLLADCFVTYLPPEYPFEVVGGEKKIFAKDFDQQVDIIPIADPNIFSQTQRISIAQTQLQMAMSNPKMHNMYQAYRDMYEALEVKNIDSLLPPPKKPKPSDPATENIMALSGKKFQAFPNQDHQAHIASHLSFMGTMSVRTNPAAMMSLQKNCLEHIGLMAQEQVQLEFKEEMQKMKQMGQQMQQMGAQAQQMGQDPRQNPQFMQMQQEMKQTTEMLESRKAVLVAESMAEYAEQEKKVLNQLDSDPLLRLKAEENQIKAAEQQRKEENDETRANLDMMKMMQAREIDQTKIEENDKHQKLRAAVSLAKSGISSIDKQRMGLKNGNK